MFGHQHEEKDDDQSSEKNTTVAPDKPAVETPAAADKSEEATPASDTAADAGAAADSGAIKTDGSPASHEDTEPSDTPPADDKAWQHPGAPIDDEDEEEEDDSDAKGPEPIKDIVGTNAGPDFKPFPQGGSTLEDIGNTPHELIDIKQNALNDLMPLADKLEQSPEDKFRTTMMIIQASDDQSLIQAAYDAAQDIKDEKVRAQALLDIVNEINYFTQHPEN
jgi:hypothetical protein